MASDQERMNVRDVGLTIDELLQAEVRHDPAAGCTVVDETARPLPLRACRLLRGLQLGMLSYEELGCPKTIVNLRASVDDLMEAFDPKLDGPCSEEVRNSLRMVHCGAEDDHCTGNPAVREWLVRFVKIFEEPLEWPVLVHCCSGWDRTGVAVAMLLLLLDVPEEIIIADFLRSHGAAERLQEFRGSLAGVAKAGGARKYFARDVDVDKVRENLRGDLGDEEEAALLRQECGRLFKFALARSSHADSRVTLTCRRIVQVEQRASRLLPSREPGLLAASGWALVQLGCCKEARAVLQEGLWVSEASAGGPGRASAGALKMMRAELARLEDLECATPAQSLAMDEADAVELLCGEALASWALSQKVVCEHERIAVSKITPEVFLGSRYGIVDGSDLLLDSLQDKVLALSGRPLAAVVNVAALEPKAQYELPEAIACHAVPIKDHVDAKLLPLLDEAVDFIHTHVSRGGACFVHCMGGYSRSASVLIAYLIRHRGLSYADACKVTKRGRPQTKPNDGFVRQLNEFERKCSKKR